MSKITTFSLAADYFEVFEKVLNNRKFHYVEIELGEAGMRMTLFYGGKPGEEFYYNVEGDLSQVEYRPLD